MINRRSFLQTSGAVISGSLCAKYLSDEALASTSAPQYMVPFTDPKFGTKVVKVTNPNNAVPGLGLTWGSIAIHHYSDDQAWNADQTLLRLDRGTTPKVFLDGNTYKPLFALKAPGDMRWHRTNPDLMVILGAKGVSLWNVRKNTVQVLNPLTGYTGANYADKGNLSDDGNMVAVRATRADGKPVAFAFNIATGQKHPDIDLSNQYEVSWTTISPKGTYIVMDSKTLSSDANEHRRVFTIDGKLVQTWPEYERPGHNDFMVDSNGDEVAIGRSKSAPDAYRMVKRRLVDGNVTVISPPCYASHTSARNLRDPGWVIATFTQSYGNSGYWPYANEVTAVATDGSGKVRRYAQHNSAPNGYFTEPHGTPSPDGKKVIFESNWGNPTGPIAAYVAQIA